MSATLGRVGTVNVALSATMARGGGAANVAVIATFVGVGTVNVALSATMGSGEKVNVAVTATLRDDGVGFRNATLH